MSGDSEFRVKLELRKVLKVVSEGLSTDNLSSLKHLCYDYISERAREEIETGRQLFDVLIEKGLISVDNLQLLCELLEEISRVDLSAKVKEFIHKKETNTLSPATVVNTLDFRHMKAISEEVGRDWKMLGRYLGLDEATLDSIQHAHYDDLKEASYQALHRWKTTSPSANPLVLKQALTDMRLMSIVHKYFDKV